MPSLFSSVCGSRNNPRPGGSFRFLCRRAGSQAGVRRGAPIEAKRQAKGRAPAAQEGAERRRHDAVAALLKLGPQALAAAGEHERIAEAHDIGCKLDCILGPEFDPLLRRNPFPYLGSMFAP